MVLNTRRRYHPQIFVLSIFRTVKLRIVGYATKWTDALAAVLPLSTKMIVEAALRDYRDDGKSQTDSIGFH